MTMKIDELFTMARLQEELAAGYVRARFHPQDKYLTILNYAEKAQYTKHWNDITRQCRGLIYNAKTGEVLARPFFDTHVRHSYNVVGVLDDRDRVVAMWRAIGLDCLQVAYGNF